jgi:hypothetical protein
MGKKSSRNRRPLRRWIATLCTDQGTARTGHAGRRSILPDFVCVGPLRGAKALWSAPCISNIRRADRKGKMLVESRGLPTNLLSDIDAWADVMTRSAAIPCLILLRFERVSYHAVDPKAEGSDSCEGRDEA